MKIKLKQNLIIVLLLLSVIPGAKLFSQAGGAAVPFLLISPDARSSAMGEVGTAIADDINAVYWNPAGLGFQDYVPMSGYDPDDDDSYVPYRQVALTFSRWLPQFNADLYYAYGTFGQYIESWDGTVAANITFMNLGEFTRTDEGGNELGVFLSNEFVFGLSYGTLIGDDLGLGFQLKYIQSNLAPAGTQSESAGTGISAAFDLGLLWKPQELDVFGLDMGNVMALGFNLQNVGPKMTYNQEADPLPTTLRLGAAFKVYQDEFNELTVTADMAKLLVYRDGSNVDPLPTSLISGWKNGGVELAGGLEWWYQRLFAIRGGYFYEPSTLGNRKFWTIGAGVKYDIFKLDFSFINTLEENHPLGNTMRFTLLIDWN
jgi:hypothetical protein